jgi:hypothetical protein
MLRHVMQRGPGDCGVACLATLTELDYEEAMLFIPDNFYTWGFGCADMARVLSDLTRDTFVRHGFSRPYRPWDRRDLAAWPAWCHMVSIRRHGTGGCCHLVVVDDGHCYDPEFKKPARLTGYRRRHFDLVAMVATPDVLEAIPKIARASR